MADIKNIKQKKIASGEAFCLQCNYEWIAILNTGITQLQCPECKTMKGLLKFPFHVSKDELYRECNCGNYLFYITPEGHLCPNCGNYQTY